MDEAFKCVGLDGGQSAPRKVELLQAGEIQQLPSTDHGDGIVREVKETEVGQGLDGPIRNIMQVASDDGQGSQVEARETVRLQGFQERPLVDLQNFQPMELPKGIIVENPEVENIQMELHQMVKVREGLCGQAGKVAFLQREAPQMLEASESLA